MIYIDQTNKDYVKQCIQKMKVKNNWKGILEYLEILPNMDIDKNCLNNCPIEIVAECMLAIGQYFNVLMKQYGEIQKAEKGNKNAKHPVDSIVTQKKECAAEIIKLLYYCYRPIEGYASCLRYNSREAVINSAKIDKHLAYLYGSIAYFASNFESNYAIKMKKYILNDAQNLLATTIIGYVKHLMKADNSYNTLPANIRCLSVFSNTLKTAESYYRKAIQFNPSSITYLYRYGKLLGYFASYFDNNAHKYKLIPKDRYNIYELGISYLNKAIITYEQYKENSNEYKQNRKHYIKSIYKTSVLYDEYGRNIFYCAEHKRISDVMLLEFNSCQNKNNKLIFAAKKAFENGISFWKKMIDALNLPIHVKPNQYNELINKKYPVEIYDIYYRGIVLLYNWQIVYGQHNDNKDLTNNNIVEFISDNCKAIFEFKHKLYLSHKQWGGFNYEFKYLAIACYNMNDCQTLKKYKDLYNSMERNRNNKKKLEELYYYYCSYLAEKNMPNQLTSIYNTLKKLKVSDVNKPIIQKRLAELENLLKTNI